ncbi:TIR domain-containing protein [Mycolicibacterium sp. Dal123E01]|uniref:TIR domain-containing protein n=1 Tax=Mycolicibacterium sp. Dal123E01 TaxID=3457578 RepID=UPI00403E5298
MMDERSNEIQDRTPDHAKWRVTDEQYDFDIAVSFAGENRGFVEDVVRRVQQSAPDIAIFYDSDYRYESWGKDGIEYFTDVYLKRSRFVAMFISKHYAEKEWPRAEKRSALARALTERNEYVLPIRIDETELTGMPPSVMYIDAVREGIEGISNGILHKIAKQRAGSEVPYHGMVATSEEEIGDLIAQKTPLWETVLYASVLYQGREKLRPLIRDHSIGFAPWNGKRLTEPSAAFQVVDDAKSDILRFTDDCCLLLSMEVQSAAFGMAYEPAGLVEEECDPQKIIHVAGRFIYIYRRLLKIAADLRGMQPTSDLANLVKLTAKLTDQPLADLESYIDDYIALTKVLQQKEASGIDFGKSAFVVRFTVDKSAMQALDEECHRLRERNSPS